MIDHRTTWGDYLALAVAAAAFAALCLLGCADLPGRHVGDSHWVLPEPDMITQLGVPVYYRGGLDPTPDEEACIRRWIDAAQLILETLGWHAPRGPVMLWPDDAVRSDGRTLGGYARITGPACRRRIVCEVDSDGRPWPYAHERLHQVGFRHPVGSDGWLDERAARAQRKADAAGEAARQWGDPHLEFLDLSRE